MAKKKNRNLQFLPLEHSNHSKDSFLYHQDRHFRDHVTRLNVISSSNESDSLASLEILLNGSGNDTTCKSSSSSLSWGTNFMVESKQKIHDELDKLHRIFIGTEPVSSEYDAEEISEWKQFFPHISIWGKCRLNANNASPTFDYFQRKSRLETRLKEQVYQNVSKRMQIERKRNEDIDYFSDYFKEIRISNREHSSKLMSSQKMSGKWLKDDDDKVEDDFSSLPFINTPNPFIRKSIQVRKSMGIERNGPLVLPPIDNPSIYHRSISATPRGLNFIDNNRYSSSSFLLNSKSKQVQKRLHRLNHDYDPNYGDDDDG